MGVLTVLDVVLAAAGSSAAMRRLIDCELLRREVKYLAENKTPPDERTRASFRNDTPAAIARGVVLARRTASSSVVLVGSAVALAILAHLLKTPWLVSATTLNVASIACLSLATVLRLGWKGQSTGGETTLERADQTLFNILFWLGTYLGVAGQL